MANTQLCLPESYLEEMELLTDEEFGHLIRELFRYRQSGGEEKVVGIGNGKFFAKRVMIQEDRNNDSYKGRCESNRDNGRKGGRPKKADSAPEETETQKPNGFFEETQKPIGFSEETQKPNGSSEKPKNPIKINKSKEKEIKENTNKPKEIKEPDGSVSADPAAVGVAAIEQTNAFEQFWKIYPRKVGKQAAYKVWSKLNPNRELAERIMQAVESQKTWPQWTKDNGQFIPHPQTWLSQGRWDDEPTEVTTFAGDQKMAVVSDFVQRELEREQKGDSLL